MTLKEVFRSAIELDREDMVRLMDSLAAVIEVGTIQPDPEPVAAKHKVKRAKKQKPVEKVLTAVVDRDGNAPF